MGSILCFISALNLICKKIQSRSIHDLPNNSEKFILPFLSLVNTYSLNCRVDTRFYFMRRKYDFWTKLSEGADYFNQNFGHQH